MAVGLPHTSCKAPLPSGAFAPRRARPMGQLRGEATQSFPAGYPPNLGGPSVAPAHPSVAPAPQHSPFTAPQAQLGLALLHSSLPRLPLLYLHVYFMISIFNASAL